MKIGSAIAIALMSLVLLSCSGGGGSNPVPPSPQQQWVVQVTGAMAQARDMHTATKLPDGRVLVIGGEVQGPGLPNAAASAELYDPVAHTWGPAGNLVHRRLGHASVLLPNGKVIVLGGWDLVAGNGVTGLLAVEEWDPTTKGFRVIGSLLHDHSGGQAFLRQDGKIQVVGGASQLDFPLYELEMSASLVPIDPSHFILLGGENGLGGWHQLDSVLFYATDGSQPNPSAGGVMPHAFSSNSAVNLPSGKIVAGGGFDQIQGISDTISIIDYAHQGSSILSVKMSKVRMGHQSMIFPDGKIGFVAGETFTGYIATTYLSDIEVLDLTTMKTTFLPVSLITPRTKHTLTPLNDGSFLIVGGYNYTPTLSSNWSSLNSCERLVYQ